ncbi:hypothetical protein KC968_01680 [Candidatus Saccharibacteria bacterium]|nr:hypothetical protein [Candidatus Saccharibacteria bacterium]
MSIEAREKVETLPDQTIATLLGEMNTEARCILVSATPNELVPLQHVKEDLEARNAYAHTSNRRFNVGGLVNSFHPAIISKSIDPIDDSAWVRRGADHIDAKTQSKPKGQESTADLIGNFAAGLAGSLLAFSADYGVPLRHVVGEKHPPKKHGFSATEARLGVLATIVTLAQNYDSFTGNDVRDLTDELGFPIRPIRGHLRDLVEYGYLQSDDTKRPKVYRSTELDNGSTSFEMMQDYLMIAAKFAIGSVHAQEKGIQQGQQILNDSLLLPRLIEKSYEASGHTGKSFTRN